MRAAVLALAAVAVLSAGCGGPAHVTFDHDQCLLDGQPATLDQVESAQAEIAQRVLGRQPLYVIVTLAVILLAGASHIEKLLLLFSTRRQEAKGLGERLKLALDRYRTHPVRYFGLVFVTLTLLGVAGGLYLYLDADKRASERALGQLQFCQLSLKGAGEQAALAEQRRNLDSLQSTAVDIKALVDRLPPEEQRKAEQLLAQMRASLTNQERMIARSDATALAFEQRTDEIKKGLGVLATGVTELKPLPEQLRELDQSVKRIDKDVAQVSDRVGKIDLAQAKLPGGRTVGQTLADIAARPACPPTVCKCEGVAPAAVAHATAARDGGAR
jgi:hypothetical protein